MNSIHTLVVGGGAFGLSAAIELRARGDRVTVIDPGPVPHPLAASTDISKVIRMDYGDDEVYTSLMERALEGWRAMNARFGEALFHETGLTYLRRSAMVPGTFEHATYTYLRSRGHALERLDAAAIRARFPAWNADIFVDGYWNPEGGWAASGRVVARLAEEARRVGVELREGTALARLHEPAGRVRGVVTRDGAVVESDRVAVCAGAWTPFLVPHLADHLMAVGLPVFLLAPADPAPFTPPRFAVFGADTSGTGYYGFPANEDGAVKIANHGRGRAMHPESKERVVTREEIDHLRAFLPSAFPALAHAPIVYTRVCLYCDTHDEHFWIAPDPERPGLVVAAGGSGHAFKFTPVLGALIADACEGKVVPKFRWRPETRGARGEEPARHR